MMKNLLALSVGFVLVGFLFSGCSRGTGGSSSSDALEGTWLDRSGGAAGVADQAGGIAQGSILSSGTVIVSTGPILSKIQLRRNSEIDGALGSSLLVDEGSPTSYEAGKMTSDSAGNAYVTGQTGTGAAADGFVARVNTDSTVVWTSVFAGAAGGADRIQDIAFGPDGFLYVVGTEALAGADTRLVVRRHDPVSGAPTAFALFDEPGTPDEGLGIALDGSGNVYVTGSANGDLLVAAFNSVGTLLWSKAQDGGFGYADRMESVRVEPSGNPIVAGRIRRSPTDTAWVIRKHDRATGTALWQQTFDPSTGEDEARGLFVDTGGNAYVVGTVVGTGDGKDVCLCKYDPSGNRLFNHNLFSGFGDDTGAGCLVDAEGNAFIVGTATRASGDVDIFVTKVPFFRLPTGPSGAPSDFVQATGVVNQTVTGVKQFTGLTIFDSVVQAAGLTVTPGSPVDFGSNPVGSLVVDQRTADPAASAVEEGRLIWRKDTDSLRVWNGSTWLNAVPPGGSIGGSGTATQVGFFTASQTLGSDPGLFWDNGLKRLGIGTTLPGSRFQVQGSTSDSTASALNATNSAASSLFFVRNDGNVGIGTTGPIARLHALEPSGVGASIAGYFQTTNAAYNSGDVMLVDYAGTATTTNVLRLRTNTAVTPSNAFVVRGDGNVGIGTSGPGGLLDIDMPDASSVTAQKIQFRSANTAQTLTDGTTIGSWRHNQFIAPTLNGVAGGLTETITEAATLAISGAPSGSNITLTEAYAMYVLGGFSRFDGTVAIRGGPASLAAATDLYVGDATASQIFIDGTLNGSTSSLVIQARDVTPGVTDTTLAHDGTNSRFTINNSDTAGIELTIDGGNVGIGTTGPGAVLDVAPAAATISAEKIYLRVVPPTDTVSAAITTLRHNSLANGALALGANNITNAATVYIGGEPTRTSGTGIISNSRGLWIDTTALSGVTTGVGLYVDAPTGATNNYGLIVASGNVGIGTTSPTNLLTLNTTGDFEVSTAGTSNLNITTAISTGGGIGLGARNTTAFFIDTTGNVGIGTAGPTGILHVVGGTAAADSNASHITIQAQAGGPDGPDPGTGGGAGGNIILLPGAAGAENVAGNVGIGTTSPASTLHVAGGVTIDDPANGITVTAAPAGGLRVDTAGTAADDPGDVFDVAEVFPSVEGVEPGDVVALDSSRRAHVRGSSLPYESTLLGVVSTSPAISIEGTSAFFGNGRVLEHDPRKPKIALAGRVPVKVCLERGPIAVGDCLTSSSIPGVAMKATEPGPTVGIALEAFDGSPGSGGKVLAFVSLGERNVAAALKRQQSRIEALEEKLARLEKLIETNTQVARKAQ